MAITLDGKIARDNYSFADWTSKEDKKHFVDFTQSKKFIVMGYNTYKTLELNNKRLPGRDIIVMNNKLNEEIDGVWFFNEWPETLVRRLEKMNCDEIALCGGEFANTEFLKSNLIDDLYITIEPKIFGSGLSLFSGEFNINLELISLKMLNKNSILLHYKVIK